LKKTIYLLFLLLSSTLFASDPITIDSMFKNQNGLRSITTFQSISSGGSDSFASYPDLVSVNEGRNWTDVKTLSLTQTFLYGLTPKLDMIASATGSTKRREYVDASGYGHKNSNDFDSLWLGGAYTFDSIGAFKPQVTAQTALYQKERFLDDTANLTLKSYSLKAAFKNYSDPVVSSLFVGTIINPKRHIGGYDIDNGNSYFLGFDMSVILSPKVSLDLGMEQRYQSESKVNGIISSNSATISTLSIGATYALDAKNSLSVSGSSGGSSRSPDSIFSVSLWQKF
jgi:hypothetical protein